MPYFSDKEHNMIPEYLVKGACYFCFERDDYEAGKLIKNIPVHKKCLEALMRDRKRFDLFTEIILKHYKMLDDCAIDLERLNSQLHGIVRNYKIIESVDKISLFILSETLIKYVFYADWTMDTEITKLSIDDYSIFKEIFD
ncbi:hypothetical protein [Paenibacillus elgii]|uniref:hypothetical protein n=1 Tax=Paenibacillus elgii TaxID=189691 RepID=UPI00203B99DC|nr:hypothetical protein [Paenibacillus elgii]MCM3271129.1 hypothetical protein [Paenibacillus elgii]